MKILNFGSLNIDITYHLDHLVRPGETESSYSRMIACGGKGLNQSTALAKAGAEVYHAGLVGKQDGGILLDMLKNAGVHTEYIGEREDCASGNAFIQVDKNGENCIVLDGGANQKITQEMIAEVLNNFEAGDYLLVQNEINEVGSIMKQAKEKGMKVVINPSPLNEKIFTYPLDLVDIFLVNEEEAQHLSSDADDVKKTLAELYPNSTIVITYGTKGSVCLQNGTESSQNAFTVKAVDTTGAGDTYTGYFLTSIMNGKDSTEAMRYASAASAISVTRNGAAVSVPTMAEVEEFLKKQ